MLRKTTALLLLIVLLFTNNVIAVQSAFEYTLQPSTGNAPGSSNFDSNVNNAVGAGNSLANAYISEAKENLNIDWLRRLELSLSYNNTLNTWLYGASMIQPFAWSFDPTVGDMLFFQLNAQKDSTNFYGNAGIGYRTLFSDRKSLIGLNAFFDEDFQNKNQRIGAGIEYFNRLAEVRANGYYGYSKPTLVSQDDNYWYYQQVANGFDFGVSLNVPSAEWLKLNATGYTNMYQYVPATTGAVFDIQAQVLPQLRLEYGYNISSGTTSSTSQFFKFNFNLGGVIGPVLFGSDNETKAIVDKDLSYKLLQPVQRNNLIVTENYKTAKPNSVAVLVTYADQATPYPGATVTATSVDNSQLIYSAVSGKDGIARITNLLVGDYNIASTINGTTYASQSSPLLVTSGMSGADAIYGPANANTGSVAITVVYNKSGNVIQNQPVIITNNVINYTANTGTSGTATKGGLKPGTYNATATVNNVAYSVSGLVVVAGAVTSGTITGPNDPTTGTITVSFKYSDGTSVSSGWLAQYKKGDVWTDFEQQGLTASQELATGSYHIRVNDGVGNYPGDGGQSVSVAKNATQAVTITGPANPELGSIKATILDSAGEKYLQSASVLVQSSNGGTNTSKSTTTGEVTIANLAPGYTDVFGVWHDYIYSVYTSIAGNKYYGSGSPTIVVTPNTTVETAINLLTGQLNLQVLHSDHSTPVAYQEVVIANQAKTFTTTVVTDKDGWVGKAVAPSPLPALTLPIGAYTATAKIYQQDYESIPKVIVITNGGILPAAIYGPPKPADVGTVQVTASYADGTPMIGWDVKIISATDPTLYYMVNTDDNGTATFKNIKSNLYYAYIRHSENDPYPPTSTYDYVSSPYQIPCEINKTSSATITGPAAPMPPTTGSIKNLVIYTDVNKTAQIASGTTINLFPPTGDPLSGTYGASGVSFLKIPLTTYTVGAYISGALKTVLTSQPLALSEATPEISNATGYVEPNPGSISVTIDFGVNTALAGKVTATWGATVVERATQAGAATFTSCLPPNTAGTQYTFAFVPTATVYGDNLVTMNRTISTGTNTPWLPSAYYKPSVVVGVHEALNPANMVSDAIISISSSATGGWVVCGTTTVTGLITPIKVWYNGNQTTKYYFKAEKAGRTVVSSAMSFNDIDPVGTLFIDW